MAKTYYLENSLGEILGYHKTLKDSQYQLEKEVKGGYPSNEIRIVSLKGQYFGEGFHQYKMYLINSKFVKVKTNQEDYIGVR